jgi:hypothetical protein
MKKFLVTNILLAVIGFNFATAADLQACNDIKDVEISADVAEKIGVIVFKGANDAAPVKISAIEKEFSLANSCIEEMAHKRESSITLNQVAQQVYAQLEGVRKGVEAGDIEYSSEQLPKMINYYLTILLSGTDF